METEKFRGFIAAIVAGISVIGGSVALVIIWSIGSGETPPRDLALVFGALTGVIGSGGTFLYMSDASSRASHASERATAAAVVLPPDAP